jgi:predicted unusual protein kinase regulating ubiquinone biosynthesis (AarF/ABC1/UbiB family)
VYADWCRPRVLVSEYVPGQSFDAMEATASAEEQRRYGEIIYRFVFGSLQRFRLFNGDPHPGNYLFPGDGTVVFLDFGSVKMFRSITREQLQGQLDAAMQGDAELLLAHMRTAGYIPSERDIDRDKLLALFQLFNRPVIDDDEFTYTREYAREVIRAGTDPKAGNWDLLRKLNLPADYLVLNRIQWGVNSILARLGARANWHRIALELMGEGPPATTLGRAEADFIAASPFLA